MIEHADAEDVLRGLSAVLSESARRAPPERIEEQILGEFGRLSPIEAESAANALGSLGKFITSDKVRGIVAAAAPAAGTIVGTAVGGPGLGSALGGSVGGVVAQAVGGKPSTTHAGTHTSQTPPPVATTLTAEPITTTPGTAASPMPVPAQHAPTGSTAAAQLLAVIQDPALLSSLLALIMGASGRSSVQVGAGQTEVPVGAMMNLVGVLANRAADDAEAILAARQDAPPAYLLDAEGCLSCDPAVPSERADALLRFIQAQRSSTAETESCGCAECADAAGGWRGDAGW